MKRLIAIIALLSLCSCGSQPSELSAVQSGPETTAATTATETTEPISSEKDTTVPDTSEAETTNRSTTTSNSDNEEDIWADFGYVCRDDYENSVNVYSDDNLSIDCCGWAVADDYLSVKFEFENKTTDNLIIKSSHTSINGYDIDIYLYDTITAGKKKIIYAEAKDKDIQSCGMTGKDVNQAEFHFTGINESSFSTIFETDVINIPIEQNRIIKQ